MEPVTLSQNTFIALVRSVLETFRLPPTSCVLQTAWYRYGHLRQMQANRRAAVASIAMRGAGICQFFFGWHPCVWHAAPDELALSKGDRGRHLSFVPTVYLAYLVDSVSIAQEAFRR